VAANRFVSPAVVLSLVDATDCRYHHSIGLWQTDLQKLKSVLSVCLSTLKVFSLARFQNSK
jgi:hypothetical protein